MFITLQQIDIGGNPTSAITVNFDHVLSFQNGFIVGNPNGGTHIALAHYNDTLRVAETPAMILDEITRLSEVRRG